MLRAFTLLIVAFVTSSQLHAGDVGSAFTYQGELLQNGSPVNGPVNLQFRLFDAPIGGAQVGSTVTLNNTPVNDGLVTVQLDFGVAVFDGAPRWLAIAVNGTNLAPRQNVTPAPYALQTRGIFVDAAQNVGIGNTSPETPLDVSGTVRGTRFEVALSSQLIHRELQAQFIPGWDPNLSAAGLFFETGGVPFSDPGGFYIDAETAAIWNESDLDILRLYNSEDLPAGSPRAVFDETGRLGIGNSNPLWPIHATAPQAVVRLDSTSNHNGSVIELRNQTPNGDFLGALNFVTGAGSFPGQIAYRDFAAGPADDNLLLRVGGADIAWFSPNAFVVQGRINTLGLGVGDESSLLNENAEPLRINRVGTDGNMVVFIHGNAVGSISVAGTTVSYNAFTGSHYAWTEQMLQRGELVRMTGVNRRLHNSAEGEVVYGVERASLANDPACLGAYLALNEDGSAAAGSDTHLVMAVGNGELWVIDTGTPIEPGDLLISSDVAGCAMLDEPARFATSFVVARAAERCDWSDATNDESGRRRARISVLFDSFTRSGTAEHLAAELAAIKAELQSLRRERPSTPGSP